MFNAWQTITDKENNSDWEYFLSTPLWMNKNVRIGNKPVFYRDWYRKGICYINDLVDEDGKYLSFEKLKDKFNINGNVMMYNSIISSLKQVEKMFLPENFKLTCPFIPSFMRTICRSKKGTKDMYSVLIKNEIIPNGKKKWGEILHMDELQWRDFFKMPFIVTNNTKLQWLQYRINHRILATNSFLFKIKVVENPYCTFCQEELKTFEHLLWNCEITKNFIEDLKIGF